MGAATALLHGDRDPSIAGMVLDSSFANLKQIAKEMAKIHTKIPSFVLSAAIKLINRSVKSRAKFDLNYLNPIEHVEETFIPALFGHAEGDDFILPHHSDELYEKYAGEKNIIKFEGSHNTLRPEFFYDSVFIFFKNALMVDELIPKDAKIEKCTRDLP